MSSKMVNNMYDKQSEQASPSGRKNIGGYQQQALFSPKTEGDQPTKNIDGMQQALSEAKPGETGYAGGESTTDAQS